MEQYPPTDVAALPCLEAKLSGGRSVCTQLASEDAATVTLRPGEHIELVFDASSTPTGSEFALKTRGRYDHGMLDLAMHDAPISYTLRQLGPNPFKSEATFELRLPRDGHVTIRVFDVTGRLVRALVDDTLGAGPHVLRWDGTDQRGVQLASGVYFVDVTSGQFHSKQRLVLLR